MENNENIEPVNEPLSTVPVQGFNEVQESLEKLKKELAKVVIGQEENITLSFAALLIGGHVLLEGVPGVAKTLIAKSLANAIELDFSRVQFTPDLMPSDVTGTSVFNMKKSEFEFKKGPAFTQILLIDEINRAPAKTQAALFEVMQEKQITNDNETYKMELPFFVMATQNPVEQEGTYQLPEAQLDRFIFKLIVDLPDEVNEYAILTRYRKDFSDNHSEVIRPVLSAEIVKRCATYVENITISDQLLQYISKLVVATRKHPDIYLGGSPRASLNILKAAKTIAAIKGRSFVTPDDIKYVSGIVLNHRIILQPEREMAGVKTEEVLAEIFNTIEVPR
jgi:MoxR-like ATPase